MTVLILGGGGQLGRELHNAIPGSVPLGHSNIDGIDLLASAEKIIETIESYFPDVIINASAMTNVDRCETEQNTALMINGVSLKHITEAARSANAYLVHVSTDYVFDGKEGNYKEDSPPNPVNYYGLSKLIGDIYANSYGKSIVVRTSGVFGHLPNFPRFAYDTLKAGKELKVMEGYYSPIHARQLAESISEILDTKPVGFLNIAGERTSRFELAQKLCQLYGLDSNLVQKFSQDLKFVAKRPFDSSLNIDKAKENISADFYNIEKGLKLLANQQ